MKANIFHTIRGKMTLLYILVFGTTLAISSIVLYTAFSHRLRADFDDSITSVASSLKESVHEDGLERQETLKDLSESYSGSSYDGPILLEIFNRDRSIVLKSPQLGEDSLPIAAEVLSRAFEGKSLFIGIKITSIALSNKTISMRTLLYPDKKSGLTKHVFVIAVPTAKIERILLQLRLIIIILIPFAMAVAAGGGWFLAGKAFKPVNQVIAAAKALEADNLHQRLPISPVDDEISRLSITLNDMIGRLERSFRAQKQFTADTSHELRTPLTILTAQIEVALQKNRDTTEYQETLKNNLEEIQRLQKIVDSLLLLSRIDSGKFNISHTPVRLDEVLLASMEKVSHFAKNKGISIDFQVIGGNAKCTDDILVPGDSASLQNVFLNILDNAIKYSKQGSKLSCTLKTVDKHAEIEIVDNGEGIPPEHMEHIFERFYRADHSQGKDGKPGAGLGLAIAKATVEAHGGTIALTSIRDQGTTARVVLPLTTKPA